MRWNMPAPEWLAAFTQLHEQHFASGEPPQPPAPTGDAFASDWHYRQDYLQGLPSVVPTTPLSQDFLQAHLPPAAASATGARSLLLSGAVRLRSHPLLRGVVQRIPQHWQMRVKNWLRA